MRRAHFLAAAALLASAATAALAASPASHTRIARGTFAGKTTAQDPVGFKVDRRNRVYSFYLEHVTLECTDGDRFDTPVGADRLETPKRERLRISTFRQFGFTVTNPNGSGWRVDGRFGRKERRASGTLVVYASFNEQNQQDPNGTVRCESELLDWSARRPRRR